MQSTLWHILLVLSSIKDIIQFYEGESDEETFIRNRFFPKNFEFLEVSNEIEDTLDAIRLLEKNKTNNRVLVSLYLKLEEYFKQYFYKEIEKGIPKDVQELSLEDDYLKNLKITFNQLTI